MARKFLLLLLLICGGLCMGQAQEDGKIVLKGVVQDARTNEPIPFVNIGLLGTVAGGCFGCRRTIRIGHPGSVCNPCPASLGYRLCFKGYQSI